MKRTFSRLALIAIISSVGSSAIAGERIPITVGTAQVLTVPRDLGEVVVGNPVIADVGVLASTRIALTANQIGFTNLVLADHEGNIMRDLEIAVVPDERAVVTLFRAGAGGGSKTDFYCIVSCAPAGVRTLGTAEEAARLSEEYEAQARNIEAERFRPGANAGGNPAGRSIEGLTRGLGLPRARPR